MGSELMTIITQEIWNMLDERTKNSVKPYFHELGNCVSCHIIKGTHIQIIPCKGKYFVRHLCVNCLKELEEANGK